MLADILTWLALMPALIVAAAAGSVAWEAWHDR